MAVVKVPSLYSECSVGAPPAPRCAGPGPATGRAPVVTVPSCALSVGPCALEYTKMKTADHFWTDPSADELVQRHRIHGGHCRQDSPSKRPALCVSGPYARHITLPLIGIATIVYIKFKLILETFKNNNSWPKCCSIQLFELGGVWRWALKGLAWHEVCSTVWGQRPIKGGQAWASVGIPPLLQEPHFQCCTRLIVGRSWILLHYAPLLHPPDEERQCGSLMEMDGREECGWVYVWVWYICLPNAVLQRGCRE